MHAHQTIKTHIQTHRANVCARGGSCTRGTSHSGELLALQREWRENGGTQVRVRASLRDHMVSLTMYRPESTPTISFQHQLHTSQIVIDLRWIKRCSDTDSFQILAKEKKSISTRVSFRFYGHLYKYFIILYRFCVSAQH